MNDTFFDALFSIEDYHLEQSLESFIKVKTAKDALKNDSVKKKLKKIDKWRTSKGYKNTNNSTDFSKYNKGTKTYNNLNKDLFIDSETKIGMFRSCLKYVATNAIKQKLKVKNQDYSLVAVFEDPKNDKLVFKNICNIKIQK